MKRESLTLGEYVTVHLVSVCTDAPSLDPVHIEDDEMQSSGRSDQEIFQNQALGVTVRRHKPPTFRLLSCLPICPISGDKKAHTSILSPQSPSYMIILVSRE